MSKIIIHNHIENDELATNLVFNVIRNEKISNAGKQYCYVSTFKVEIDGEKRRVVVSAFWNKKETHTFKVYFEEG